MKEIETKIIIDTDIGEDIDDTWALIFLLSSRFVDIKLISVTTGDVKYKAKIVAKILTLINKTNIPIALGKATENECYAQKRWTDDFDISNYQGHIYSSASKAYKEILTKYHDCLIVGLAPFSTLAMVKSTLVQKQIPILAMAGSVFKGYFNSDTPSIECNIVTDINASKAIFNADIPLTIVPLDVCGGTIIRGKQYQQIKKSSALPSKIVMENYQIWQQDYVGGAVKLNIDKESSYLYDLVAVWPLIFPQNFDTLNYPIYISDDGYTKIGGKRNVSVITKMHKHSLMVNYSVEQFRTDTQKTSNILKLGVDKMYSLTYILHNPNVSLSVAEIGWEQRFPGSSFGPLVRDYYILHVVVSGKGTLYIGNNKKEFKAGDCFIVPPNEKVKYDADTIDPCKYYWVGYTGTSAKELTTKANFTKENNYVNTPTNFNEIASKIKTMVLLKVPDQSVSYYLLGNLYILFSKFFSEEPQFEHTEEGYVEKAMKYIDTHYNENISIQNVSDYVVLERTYFFRLFKEQTNLSPKEYLTNVRIEQAKKLLKETNQPLSNISISVGYPNYLSFFNIFMKKVGVSPSEYRERLLKKQQKYKSRQHKSTFK